MKKLCCLCLVLGLWCVWGNEQVYAQQRLNNLIFNSTDQIIGLKFTNPDSPEVFYTGKKAKATIGEGIAHAENEAGEIVFWVNSSGVYDRNNVLMPGSAGILAHPSSTEIVIAPFPDNAHLYYIFYNNQLCSTLYYSVVDLEARTGLGDVVQLNKSLAAEKSFAEGLEVIRIPCSKDYWLIANECGRGLTRFQVNARGISEGVLFLQNPYQEGGRGELDYHKGKIGYAITYHSSCLLADFDPLTGSADKAKYLSLPLQNGAYGLEFSPGAFRLYVTDLNNLDIFGRPAKSNLCAIDLASGAVKSWNIRNTSTSCSSAAMEGLGHIEMGKDGRLYISQIGGCEIVAIEQPDTDSPQFIRLPVNTVLSAGISDHIQSDFLDEDLLQQASVVVQDQPYLCGENPVVLKAVTASAGILHYQWYRNGEVIQQATAATYSAKEQGSYSVGIQNTYGCSLQTEAVMVEDARIPALEYQSYYESCAEARLSFPPPPADYKLRWFDGSDDVTKLVTQSGEYAVTIFNDRCERTELIRVNIRPFLSYKIPNVITPNGDGLNETFEIIGLEGASQLFIYNRWGKLIYHSADYQNEWQGERLSSGLYYYRLMPSCGEEQKGWVQVLLGQ